MVQRAAPYVGGRGAVEGRGEDDGAGERGRGRVEDGAASCTLRVSARRGGRAGGVRGRWGKRKRTGRGWCSELHPTWEGAARWRGGGRTTALGKEEEDG